MPTENEAPVFSAYFSPEIGFTHCIMFVWGQGSKRTVKVFQRNILHNTKCTSLNPCNATVEAGGGVGQLPLHYCLMKNSEPVSKVTNLIL